MRKNVLLYINISICSVIACGFFLIAYINYSANSKMLENDINDISKLTSENIYSKINSLLERPIHVSLTMANDHFLKEWLNKEKQNLQNSTDINQLKEYLLAYKNKYKYDSVFLVSDKSKIYYHYNGIDRVITPGKPEDLWYTEFIAKNTDYDLFVDIDAANQNAITVFVNCLVLDDDKDSENVLGAVGVGLRTDYVQSLLQSYETEFMIKAYLIDVNGELQVSSKKTRFSRLNFFDTKKIQPLKEEILRNKQSQSSYKISDHGVDTYYSIQYIPNLNWFLIIEKDTTLISKNFYEQFFQKTCVIILITFFIIYVISKELRCCNTVITNLINNDSLTGVRNRTSYEETLQKYNKLLNSHTQIGLGIFDLNGLKYINDTYGHAMGDNYISSSARLICQTFEHSPIFRIGGDEFVVVFDTIDETTVCALHEKFLVSVAQYNAQYAICISIAFGYAFFDSEKDNSLEQLFSRADANMYLDKMLMKNEKV